MTTDEFMGFPIWVWKKLLTPEEYEQTYYFSSSFRRGEMRQGLIDKIRSISVDLRERGYDNLSLIGRLHKGFLFTGV